MRFFNKNNSLVSLINHIDYESVKGFLIILILFFGVLFIKKNKGDFKEYNYQVYTINPKKVKHKYNSGTRFVLKMGHKRFAEGNITAAFKEYEYAYLNNPNSVEIYQMLIETLSVLSKKNASYCSQLDFYLNHWVKQ